MLKKNKKHQHVITFFSNGVKDVESNWYIEHGVKPGKLKKKKKITKMCIWLRIEGMVKPQ